MVVIGFFQQLLGSFGGLLEFISKPLGEISDKIDFEPFSSMSILTLMGSSLVITLSVLLVMHLVRLFIGG